MTNTEPGAMRQHMAWITRLPAEARRIGPGLALSGIIAMAATFISDHHGGPTLLYALLVGMAFNFTSKEPRYAPGIAFASRTVLRIGVALLGARISAGQIAELGITPVLLVPIAVFTTIAFGWWLAPRLGLSQQQGVLTGGSVAICGASAALAISAVLPQTKEHERDTLFTVISVTILSTVAMIFYPTIVNTLGMDDRAAGIMLGGTIHDVAQVVGAGHMISDEAGLVATYVKLLRVAMLMPVVTGIAWIIAKRGFLALSVAEAAGAPGAGAKGPVLPLFLVAFAVLAVINSLGLIPEFAVAPIIDSSRWCLVVAIAALGMKTSLQDLSKLGWRPLALVVTESLFILVMVLVILGLETWLA
ncbi:YeiH family protein [Phaeovulum sp.]|uniref:YeiH family protein n=1 Tax=Phaeovulum sp. TaxID=2934796 RepID=UPI002730A400|nr:YeiH family protein [Phaeovulum sp.]MDP1668221.1 YeiH family protein [Phaeovulum sp.]MDZ4118070.1 YeiH family protein [Phaeovulum sp.]